MPHDLETRLGATWPVGEWCDVTVLVAVSGGADSVALLRALAGLRQHGLGRLIVAHFNHGLRGAESDGDARFVQSLADTLGLPCEVGTPAGQDAGKLDHPDVDDAGASEECTRGLRYAFLQQAGCRLGARYVVTAHTADDQAETILHRILRGTGLAGLAGMRRARPLTDGMALLRPLLDFRRDELRAYLADIGQPFRHDASNLDPRYTRNRIRHELLPQLADEYNPRVAEALLRLGSLAREAQTALLPQVESLADRSRRQQSQDRLELDCATLASKGDFLLREALIAFWRIAGWPEQAMSRQHWDRLAAIVLADPSSEKTTLPGNITAERQGGVLLLYRLVGK